MIGEAFDVRNNSDYEDFYVLEQVDVELQMNNAKEFLDAANKFLTTPPT